MNGSLLGLLRDGGYILYARHGEATIGEDWPNLDFRHCYTQRNLSESGRKQAISYGRLVRTLRIPISYPVVASPFCRTVETAQLAFGWDNVEIDRFWAGILNLSGSITATEEEEILQYMQSEFETIPLPETNHVIIAHGFPDKVGLGTIPNMGTVIIKPLGWGNGYRVMAKLSLDDLAAHLLRC